MTPSCIDPILHDYEEYIDEFAYSTATMYYITKY